MERHFERDLEELKQRLLWMGSLAERAVHQAVHAVLDADERLAEAVLTEEDAINEMQIEIDERVQRLLALQAPMAADLRFLLAVSRINGDLERIGDGVHERFEAGADQVVLNLVSADASTAPLAELRTLAALTRSQR